MLELIQKLREITGAGVMDCKRAMSEANGDFEKAKKIIEEKGIASASKKSERETGAGVIESYIHANRVGVLLVLRCETDFVARATPFKELAHNIAMHITAMAPETIEGLLSQPFVKDQALTVENLIKKEISHLGENIKVERFSRFEL